jgi:O-antigen/teichoic acid export membrane protein
MTIPKTQKRLLYLITSSSLLFYALSGLSSLLNYVIYPTLSRLVSVERYGEIQFLLSSFNQLAVGFVVLNILAVIITVTTADIRAQKSKIKSLNIVAGLIALGLALIGIVLLLMNMSNLQLTSSMGVIFIGVALILNVPFTILVGQLQGSDKFVQSGIVSIVATFSKFIFSIAFVLLGLGVAGAMLGVALGMGLSLILGYFYIDKTSSQSLSLKKHVSNLSNLKYTSLVGLFCVAILTLLSTIDSITSRIILNSTEAGMYAAVATLAKIILAGTTPLLWLTLPPAILGKKYLVKRYFIITILVCFALVVAFSLNPSVLINVSMSINAGIFAQLLPLAAVSMSIYAIAFIVTAILICVGKLRILFTTYVIAIGVFVLSLLFMNSYLGSISMAYILVAQLITGFIILSPLSVSLINHLRTKA